MTGLFAGLDWMHKNPQGIDQMSDTHTHAGKTALSFIGIFSTCACMCPCVCARVHVCLPAPTGQMTHNRKESRTKQHRQVGEVCM